MWGEECVGEVVSCGHLHWWMGAMGLAICAERSSAKVLLTDGPWFMWLETSPVWFMQLPRVGNFPSMVYAVGNFPNMVYAVGNFPIVIC